MLVEVVVLPLGEGQLSLAELGCQFSWVAFIGESFGMYTRHCILLLLFHSQILNDFTDLGNQYFRVLTIYSRTLSWETQIASLGLEHKQCWLMLEILAILNDVLELGCELLNRHGNRTSNLILQGYLLNQQSMREPRWSQQSVLEVTVNCTFSKVGECCNENS